MTATLINGYSKLAPTQLRGEIRAAAKMGLVKVAVQWLNEHLCFLSSAVLAESFVLRIRHLRQAPARYQQCHQKFPDINKKL